MFETLLKHFLTRFLYLTVTCIGHFSTRTFECELILRYWLSGSFTKWVGKWTEKSRTSQLVSKRHLVFMDNVTRENHFPLIDLKVSLRSVSHTVISNWLSSNSKKIQQQKLLSAYWLMMTNDTKRGGGMIYNQPLWLLHCSKYWFVKSTHVKSTHVDFTEHTKDHVFFFKKSIFTRKWSQTHVE